MGKAAGRKDKSAVKAVCFPAKWHRKSVVERSLHPAELGIEPVSPFFVSVLGRGSSAEKFSQFEKVAAEGAKSGFRGEVCFVFRSERGRKQASALFLWARRREGEVGVSGRGLFRCPTEMGEKRGKHFVLLEKAA